MIVRLEEDMIEMAYFLMEEVEEDMTETEEIGLS